MASIENQQQQKISSGRKSVKKSTRVDLTPMVDLGFLLITFFVFTSTMARPTVMKVEMPYDKIGPNDPVCSSCALTTVLCDNNSIRYYEGGLDTALIQETNYKDIGQVIRAKKQKLEQGERAGELVLIIKPSARSTFKNFVDITDEVTINNIRRYYIDELKAAEADKVMK